VFRYPVCSRCLRAPEPLDAEFFCVSCRTPFQNPFPLDSEGRCALCRSDLRSFDAAYSFAAYEGVLRKLVHLYKYAKIRTLAGPLGDLLVPARPLDERFDAVVPIPLHGRRRWKRGFNQSDLLARVIARRSGVPVVPALSRVRSTRTQAGLSNHARRQNMTKAFRARRIDGRTVLLIDDVMATGSTAAACAQALKGAGARRVVVLTVACADRRLPGGRLIPDSKVGESIEHA
jgi:ComF family protein